MEIVITGALPPAYAANALVKQLANIAPSFIKILEKSQHTITESRLLDTGCTPYEYWLLQQKGFQPDTKEQAFSAGLGPLYWNKEDDNEQAIYIIEPVYLNMGQQNTQMVPASELNLSTEESDLLYASAHELMAQSPFKLINRDGLRWQVTLDPKHQFTLPGIDACRLLGMDKALPRDSAHKDFRVLFNEFQMTWHTLSLNNQRQAQGLVPINSIWLYGGAKKSQLKTSTVNAKIYDGLALALFNSDWNHWLWQVAEYEKTVFAPILEQKKPCQLLLTGLNHYIELDYKPSRFRLFSKPNEWKIWWSQLV